MIDMEHKE